MEILNETTESLVSYYLLPMVGINFRTFGPYFVDALLYPDVDVIRVELLTGCKEEYWNNPNYQGDYTKDNKTFVIFAIPEQFSEDVAMFKKGKYSHFKPETKKLIYDRSGLHYNKQIDNLIVTDMKLLALSRHPKLKEWIEESTGLRYGSNVELIRLKNPSRLYVKD